MEADYVLHSDSKSLSSSGFVQGHGGSRIIFVFHPLFHRVLTKLTPGLWNNTDSLIHATPKHLKWVTLPWGREESATGSDQKVRRVGEVMTEVNVKGWSGAGDEDRGLRQHNKSQPQPPHSRSQDYLQIRYSVRCDVDSASDSMLS